jgi:hypothetical protein
MGSSVRLSFASIHCDPLSSVGWLSLSYTLLMSGMMDVTDASADTLRDRGLEVVAKLGWLSKNAYSLSKTVHAFAKPIRVRLTEDAPAGVVRQLLLRAPLWQCGSMAMQQFLCLEA